jgi:hypothetical protein
VREDTAEIIPWSGKHQLGHCESLNGRACISVVISEYKSAMAAELCRVQAACLQEYRILEHGMAHYFIMSFVRTTAHTYALSFKK